MAPILRGIIQTSYFRVVVVEDVDTVECCGALKVQATRKWAYKYRRRRLCDKICLFYHVAKYRQPIMLYNILQMMIQI